MITLAGASPMHFWTNLSYMIFGFVGIFVTKKIASVIGKKNTLYATLGMGAAYIQPKSDNYVGQAGTLMALGAGGGLEITFKKQITLRLDARNWSLFDENESTNYQEYSGGLAIFF